MKTPITDMVAEMLDNGVSNEAVIVAILSMEMSRTIVPDKEEIIREYERGKKQKQRGKSKETRAEANDAAARNIPGTVPDAGEKCCNLALSSYQESKEVKKERKITTRGTRLSGTAQLPETDRAYAVNAGVRDPDGLWAEFVDYWVAVPGQRGAKLDWSATWRNRVRHVTGNKLPSNVVPMVAPSGVWIKSDSPQWAAWQRYKKTPIDKNFGWRFPSEWPPGYEATVTRERIRQIECRAIRTLQGGRRALVEAGYEPDHNRQILDNSEVGDETE